MLYYVLLPFLLIHSHSKWRFKNAVKKFFKKNTKCLQQFYITAKNWKQATWPLADEWINNLWYIHQCNTTELFREIHSDAHKNID